MDISLLSTGSFHCFGLSTRTALGELVHVNDGIYASPEPPFSVDDWWQEHLGKIEVEAIKRYRLFLFAQTDFQGQERTLSDRLMSHYLSLLVQGVGYCFRGVTLAGANSLEGRRVTAYGKFDTYREPYKVIAKSVTKEHLLATPKLAERIDFVFADKDKYLRLRKGFNAFLAGIKQRELHGRLHNFVRAIEAVIKPKPGEGTRKFTYRCQFFAGRKPMDVSLLGELYELRSAAEHLNPMNDKLENYKEYERDNIKGLRTFQAELLAAHVYRKILGDPNLLENFSSDKSIDLLWSKDYKELGALWGDTLDLHTARGRLRDLPHDGLFLDFLS